MTTPAHLHFVLSGTLSSGEVFATGFDLQQEASDQADLNAHVATVKALLDASNPTTIALQRLLAPGSSWTSVRAYSYAAGALAASFVAEGIIALAGAGTTAMPNQVSLVATLKTAVPSRRTRGRMFLPANGARTDASGQLQSPSATEASFAVANIITAVGSTHPAVVLSKTGGLATLITSVNVDTRFDIQRRRADHQAIAGHGTTAIVYGG